jgi:hypothetical protein
MSAILVTIATAMTGISAAGRPIRERTYGRDRVLNPV